eukprot:gene15139-16695_t
MEIPEKTDRSDRTSFLRQQTSRIYMTTIAANEREDRLLNKKLDALDLEHRSQFSRLKKWIHCEKQGTERRFPRLSTPDNVNQTGHRQSLPYITPLIGGSSDLKTARKKSSPNISRMPRKSIDSTILEMHPGGIGNLPDANQTNRSQVKLHSRIRYTENEVDRLRKSYSGQKAHLVRSRSQFLPKLEPLVSPNESGRRDSSPSLRKAMLMNAKEKTMLNLNMLSLENKIAAMKMKQEVEDGQTAFH